MATPSSSASPVGAIAGLPRDSFGRSVLHFKPRVASVRQVHPLLTPCTHRRFGRLSSIVRESEKCRVPGLDTSTNQSLISPGPSSPRPPAIQTLHARVISRLSSIHADEESNENKGHSSDRRLHVLILIIVFLTRAPSDDRTWYEYISRHTATHRDRKWP